MREINPIERPRTLMELAYEEIKELLTTGHLEFEKIYSANQFADMLKVSRTPVREALLQLTAEGFLVSVQGRGFKIRDFSQKEVRDFFETRGMIETYVIEHLVGSLVEQDLQRLEESCHQMGTHIDSGNTNAFLEADKEFHMNLVHRYNNFLLKSIMGDIRDLISIFGQRALSHAGRTQEVVSEHRRILDGLRRRDGQEAVRAMLYHLETTENYLIENLELK
jgi:DNA-binding GntR family transcriptional regulator